MSENPTSPPPANEAPPKPPANEGAPENEMEWDTIAEDGVVLHLAEVGPYGLVQGDGKVMGGGAGTVGVVNINLNDDGDSIQDAIQLKYDLSTDEGIKAFGEAQRAILAGEEVDFAQASRVGGVDNPGEGGTGKERRKFNRAVRKARKKLRKLGKVGSVEQGTGLWMPPSMGEDGDIHSDLDPNTPFPVLMQLLEDGSVMARSISAKEAQERVRESMSSRR